MSDAAPYTFRTALGGFHKGDVSAYIARSAREHKSQLSELQAQLALLEQENQSLRTLLAEQEPEAPSETAAPAEAQEPEPTPRDRELEAYRRAEATERLAYQRAKKLYESMQRICDRSTRELEESDIAAQDAAANINVQLEIIRTAVEGLYDGIRASAKELGALSQMAPDPAEALEEV